MSETVFHLSPPAVRRAERLITLKEAADRLCFSTRTIARLLDEGELEGCGRNNRRRVLESSVDAYIARHRDRGAR